MGNKAFLLTLKLFYNARGGGQAEHIQYIHKQVQPSPTFTIKILFLLFEKRTHPFKIKHMASKRFYKFEIEKCQGLYRSVSMKESSKSAAQYNYDFI